MHDNERNAAPVASRSRLALILVAAAFLLVPLVGCDIEPLDLDFSDVAYGDVQVNVSATKTSVGACVSRGLLGGPLFGPCKGPEDGFSFVGADNQWHYAPETVDNMPAGTPLTVYWKGPEGQTSFEVSLPPVISISAPEANASYRMGDTVSLQWPDLGSDEITVENQGSCVGDDPTEWRRVVPSENASHGQLMIRVEDLVQAVRPFERCDITLRVTAARQGTYSSTISTLSGTITARTTAEVTIQIQP